jgi:stringent starvation protein B
MTSSRPYLIRAIYQWIVDNGATPHLLVDASYPSVCVPREYVENNKIILNIGPMAAHGLKLGNEHVEFSARFSGKSLPVVVPIGAVLAIYARENGQGMVFNENDGRGADKKGVTEQNANKPQRPKLRVVK